MRKYLYTTLLLALLAQEGVMAQENEGKKGGFFGKIKDTFSTEIKIGNYTFKDGSVYTGEMKGRKPNGKGKTVFKNGDVFEGEYVKGKREGYGIYMFPDGEKYEGQWFQDQQHGKGIYYFMNNNRYDGMWYQDYQHGEGTMYYHNGRPCESNKYIFHVEYHPPGNHHIYLHWYTQIPLFRDEHHLSSLHRIYSRHPSS